MYCPECDVEHAEWADEGTTVNSDGRTTLDLWECDRCGFVLEGCGCERSEEIVERIREQFRIDPTSGHLPSSQGKASIPTAGFPSLRRLRTVRTPTCRMRILTNRLVTMTAMCWLTTKADPEPAPVETPDGPVDSWFDAGWRWPRPVSGRRSTSTASSGWATATRSRSLRGLTKMPQRPAVKRDTLTPVSVTATPGSSGVTSRSTSTARRSRWGGRPRLDGRVFLQTDEDPYAFVDGDDVRDPETGEVHPAFVEILEQLGISYADISTSGAGVHVYYRGELPERHPTGQLAHR